MYRRVSGFIQGMYKNGRLHSTSFRNATNKMFATVTNNDCSWSKNAGGYGYSIAPSTTDKTTVVVGMGIDGECDIEVVRDNKTIYSVSIAPEHLSAIEKDKKEVDIKVQP